MDQKRSHHHIAVVLAPVLSHQMQISELCKRVLLQHHPNYFQIKFIVPVLHSLSSASKTLLSSLSANHSIETIVLPPIINLPQDTVPSLKLPLAMSHSLPSILQALESIASTSKLIAIVADYFAYQVLPFANKRNILSYVFFPSSASLLSLCFHSSTLHETIPCEYREMPEPIHIPGCVPIHGRDLPTSLQDRSSESYRHFLLRSKALRLADGIIINSFLELEASAVRAITESTGGGNPSVYMIGPILQNEIESFQNDKLQLDCLAWLDEQAPKSVLYVSFGSGGTISQLQMNELALGLEQSGQKFMWVVREPNDSPSGNYFGGSSGKDPLSYLPDGFLERTKYQGLVIPNWAPQVQILSHQAIGAFLTQCGWFSTIEAIVNGLPIIAWPLFSEQRMNAAILTDGLKVAVRPKGVDKCEIANVVKSVIMGDEGIGIRERIKVLQDAAASAIKIDGSSTNALSELVAKLKDPRTIFHA